MLQARAVQEEEKIIPSRSDKGGCNFHRAAASGGVCAQAPPISLETGSPVPFPLEDSIQDSTCDAI